MKFKEGQKFILETSLGNVETRIKAIRYEFEHNIKGGSRFLTEEETQHYIDKGVLVPGDWEDIKNIEIQQLEKKYGIHLKEVE